MISCRRLTLLVGAILITASAALAQTTGTINITGATPEAFSLTNTSGGALSPATITFTAMTPANSTSVVSDSVTVRMRSNKAYKLSAQASVLTISGAGLDDDGDPIKLTDIGIGITGMTLTGANVATGGSGRSETILAGYSVPSGNWPAATNGLTPTFGKTLADIQSSTEILQGKRISKKGNLATSDNFIEVNVGVATLPQFFTPNTGFSATITLTMASQ
jgi:hypothetical protein